MANETATKSVMAKKPKKHVDKLLEAATEQRVAITVRVPYSLYEQLRRAIADKNVSMQELLLSQIRDFVEEHS